MKGSLFQVVASWILVSQAIASDASADLIYIQSIPSSAATETWEGVTYTSSGVGFAAIRFEVDEPVFITSAVANLFNFGLTNLFFAGIEELPSMAAVPSYTLAAGPSTLLAYSEATASRSPGSQVEFPLDVVLEPGIYALVVGCPEFDCIGGLPSTSDPGQFLIPEEDFLVSYGTPSTQSWNFNPLHFRLALLWMPEPSRASLLGAGIGGLALLARLRRRSE